MSSVMNDTASCPPAALLSEPHSSEVSLCLSVVSPALRSVAACWFDKQILPGTI